MLRYEAWIDACRSEVPSEFMQLAEDDRIARIKLLIANLSPLANQQLSSTRRSLVGAWIEHRLLENMPREQRERLEKFPPGERRRMIARLVWQRTSRETLSVRV